MTEAWAFEHSMECPVSREFAWRFWTDVSNWRLDADVESVELDGPFAAGSSGATISRSSGRVEWRIASVEAKTEALIEVPLQGALMQIRWKFDDLGERTRITQRMSVGGEGAVPLVNAAASIFETNIPAGMQKLCAVMTETAARAS
jgi:hypothetical protein